MKSDLAWGCYVSRLLAGSFPSVVNRFPWGTEAGEVQEGPAAR